MDIAQIIYLQIKPSFPPIKIINSPTLFRKTAQEIPLHIQSSGQGVQKCGARSYIVPVLAVKSDRYEPDALVGPPKYDVL
jgi:hypothetical protein